MNNIQILKENKTLGFEALADLTGLSKEEVKKLWNRAGLGWKHIPRTQISTTALSDGRYRLNDDIVVFLDRFTPIIIPQGFKTDFGSVPKFLHWFIDKDDRHFLVGFILHDVHYLVQSIDRGTADSVLRLNAGRLGASWIRKNAVYYALRMFGGLAWHKNKQRNGARGRVTQAIAQATERYKKDNSLLINS